MQHDLARSAAAGLFNGEAVTLWRLRRDSGALRCFVAEWPGAFWLGVECPGGQLIMSDTLPTIDEVLAQAASTRAALQRDGWLEA